MSFTNSTPNYGLPQYIGTDKPTYLGDINTAYSTIDTQMKANADAAAAATSTANTAASAASAASTNATTALNTANSAASEAASATSAAASATSTANTAATNAAAALRASAANSIANLAPAYDPTLTYAVGDLVTYIDDQNSGKLYKCIVAVASPMDFNINYWDDVTTNEVYAPARGVVQVIADGVKTHSQLMDELYALCDKSLIGEKSCMVRETSSVISHYYPTDFYLPGTINFSKFDCTDSILQVQHWSMRESGSIIYGGTVAADGTISITNNSSIVDAAGDKYTIIY